MYSKILTTLYQQKIIIQLIFMSVILLAFFSLKKISKLAYPPVDDFFIEIVTYYPGAGPSDIEMNITYKIENALKKVDGILRVNSNSTEEYSHVWVRLDPNFPDDKKRRDEIRREVDQINDFPPDLISRPQIYESKTSTMSIFGFALFEKNSQSNELQKSIENIKNDIRRIKHVSNVIVKGELNEEIKIQINLKKLNKYHLDVIDVYNAIKHNKFRITAGPINSKNQYKNIISLAPLEKANDYKKIVIRSNYSGKSIKLSDVATIVQDFEKKRLFHFVNRKPAIIFEVKKRENHDIITTVDEIKNYLKKKKLNYVTTIDESKVTRQRIELAKQNAIIGFILVVCVLFIFLDSKIAFWAAMGVPFSLLIGSIFFPLFSITLNSISLCGVIIILGLAVDDAIVMSESVLCELEVNNNKLNAMLNGAKKVAGPIITTVITTIIAFMPIQFLPDQMGDYAREIPQIITIVLIASLFEALFLLPVHICRHVKDKSINKITFRHHLINYIKHKYEKILHQIIKYRLIIISSLLIVLILGLNWQSKNIKFILFPTKHSDRIEMWAELENGTNIEHTEKITIKITKKIQEIIGENLEVIVSTTGKPGRPNYILINITLRDFHLRNINADEIAKKLQNESHLEKYGIIKKYIKINNNGINVGRDLSIIFYSNNNEQRKLAIKEFLETLKEFPVYDVDTSIVEEIKEMRIIPKYNEISKLQTSSINLANTIKSIFEGLIVDYQNTPKGKIPIRLVFDKDSSKNFNNFYDNLKIKNSENQLISVKKISKIENKMSKAIVRHLNAMRLGYVEASIDKTKMTPGEMYPKLINPVKEILKKYPDVSTSLRGEAQQSRDTFNDIMIAFLIAFFGIYFLLVFQFKNYVDPLIISSAIPFALLSVLVVMSYSNEPLTLFGTFGIIGFIGIVVNDSLILVHFIESNVKKINIDKKEDLVNVVVKSSIQRIRPIFLTTITTISGIMPAAYGLFSRKDYFISPMLFTMSWGILFGTIFVLIIVPLCYIFIYDSKCFLISLKRIILK